MPVSGIPVSVTRTYDTLQSGTSEDFGYGWRLEFGNTDLRSSVAKTGRGRRAFQPLLPTPRFRDRPRRSPRGVHLRPTVAPGLTGSFLGILDPAFPADPGVTDTLSVDPDDLRRFDDGTYATTSETSPTTLPIPASVATST